MNLQKFITVMLCVNTFILSAQTDIKAWYADGQVWIIWKTQAPYPETYAIYKSAQPFTNTNQANVIGRPFHYEYLPGTFIQQTNNPAFTYKIPKPDGSLYVLQPDEALFVETTTNSGSAYYAVVEWGKTTATAGTNRTQNSISFNYDPIKEPVICHLQFNIKLNTGHKTYWYCLWLMGRQDENSGRPDFPVMANAFKNGMPSMFIISLGEAVDTTNGMKIPVTHWLHGGGGVASNCIANGMPQFNIAPYSGISVAHNDDFPQKLISNGDTVFSTARTQWFGWTRNHNPFDPAFDAGPGDTIINYTQRRILWINDWLIKYFHVDRNRVAIQGYSMGSAGASALGKEYPGLFSTVCAFNNGFRKVNEETIDGILGKVEENLPTNILNYKNELVHINEIFDLNTKISASRDLPLFRTWAGKNDNNSRMHWGPDLVAQYRVADSLGSGIQINWDEREHTYPTLGIHWIEAEEFGKQTIWDDVANQEGYHSKETFPAFFNQRLDSRNNDPGTGIQGIDKGDGDNWGTWGGYHDWWSIRDEIGRWVIGAMLNSKQNFHNDNCPVNSLIADLAIRRPQKFKPKPGTKLNWRVNDWNTGTVLQSGEVIVRNDSLVVVPQVEIYKWDIRIVQITIEDLSVSTDNLVDHSILSNIHIIPNPSSNNASITMYSKKALTADMNIFASGKILLSNTIQLHEGNNSLPLTNMESLPAGFYLIELKAKAYTRNAKWVKLR